MCLSLPTLALALGASAAPAPATSLTAPGTADATPAARSADAMPDSVRAVTALTADQLTHYLAVKRALGAYWAVPAHAALLKTARATGHVATVHFGQQTFQFGVFDYPALVQQDTALAALFTKNHFAPAQFEPVQAAVWQAIGTALLAQVTNTTVPTTSALGQNVALVQAHRPELTAVGIDEGMIQ